MEPAQTPSCPYYSQHLEKKSIIALKLITSNGLIRADTDISLSFRGNLFPSALCFRIPPLCGGIAAEIESVIFQYYLHFQTVLLTDAPGKTQKLQLFLLFGENVIEKYSYNGINAVFRISPIRNDLPGFE